MGMVFLSKQSYLLPSFKCFFKFLHKREVKAEQIMQAVKDKINDMKEMRKVKSGAKAEEKAEKELAKARVDVAHEIRLAREAEGAMEMHVANAGERVEREIAKHHQNPNQHSAGSTAKTTTATMGMGNTTANTPGAPPKSNYL